jgi:PTS system nitrogen regulatory IIA component
MGTADLLSPGDVMLDIAVANRRELLERLSTEAASRLGQSRREIAAALEAREQLGSTALRDGVAFPHAQLAGIGRPLMLFARLRQPIYLDSRDDEPVDLIFLTLWPIHNTKGFLSAIGAISKVLREPTVVRRLRLAATAQDVVQLLSGMRGRGTGGPDPE